MKRRTASEEERRTYCSYRRGGPDSRAGRAPFRPRGETFPATRAPSRTRSTVNAAVRGAPPKSALLAHVRSPLGLLASRALQLSAMELGSSYLDTSLNESSSQPSAPPAGAFDNDDWTNVLQPLAEASQRAHQLHASTSQNLLDPPLVPESAVGDPLLDGGEPRLSNARMSKKPKPRQPAPEGVTVTDKSCARCRLRKGALRSSHSAASLTRC